MARGLQLRHQLDPAARNNLKTNASVLAKWMSAVRIVRAKRGRDEAEPPERLAEQALAWIASR